jgi:hypothetical protein
MMISRGEQKDHTKAKKKKTYNNIALEWGSSVHLTGMSAHLEVACRVTSINKSNRDVFNLLTAALLTPKRGGKWDHMYVFTDVCLSEAELRELTKRLRYLRIKKLDVVVLCETANAMHPFLFHSQTYRIRRADKSTLYRGIVDNNITQHHLFNNVINFLALKDLFRVCRRQIPWYDYNKEYTIHLQQLYIEQLTLTKYRQIEKQVEWDLVRGDRETRRTVLESTLDARAASVIRECQRNSDLESTTLFPLSPYATISRVLIRPEVTSSSSSTQFRMDHKAWRVSSAFTDFKKLQPYPDDKPTVYLKDTLPLTHLYGQSILRHHPFEILKNPQIQTTLAARIVQTGQEKSICIILHPAADLHNELVVAMLIDRDPLCVPLTPLWLLAFFLTIQKLAPGLWLDLELHIHLYLRRYIRNSFVPLSMSHPTKEPSLRVPCDIALTFALNNPYKYTHLSGVTGHIYATLNICAVSDPPVKSSVCIRYATAQLQKWVSKMLRFQHSSNKIELAMRLYAWIHNTPHFFLNVSGPKIFLLTRDIPDKTRSDINSLSKQDITLVPPFLETQAIQLEIAPLSYELKSKWARIVDDISLARLGREIPCVVDEKEAKRMLHHAQKQETQNVAHLLLRMRNTQLRTKDTTIALFKPSLILRALTAATSCAGFSSEDPGSVEEVSLAEEHSVSLFSERSLPKTKSPSQSGAPDPVLGVPREI